MTYSVDGRTWRLLPISGREPDGTTVVRVSINRTLYLATWDGQRGPARVVFARCPA